MKQSSKPMDSLGLYLAIPFCRAKCSFCNFASDAFAPGRLPPYIDRLCSEISSARSRASRLGADLPEQVDTLYLGGGTPSLLSPGDVSRTFGSLRDQFTFSPEPEITIECAPSQLSQATLEEFQRQGVNRLSFGVQSFIDREATAIGRLHTAAKCLEEIGRAQSSGILNISIDLIAGLPYQTELSWRASLAQARAAGVPHISIYMFEIDDDSRLGREILAQGSRYGAPAVPSDDDSAGFYEIACDLLNDAGVTQYEISNFSRPGFRSAHNLKYWQRKPYLGFGLDAHSMLRTSSGAVRFSNTDDLNAYLASAPRNGSREAGPLALFTPTPSPIADILTQSEAFEETLFLGLRINDGLGLDALVRDFGPDMVDLIRPALAEAAADRLLTLDQSRIRLTARGRVLSNEVFSRLLLPSSACHPERSAAQSKDLCLPRPTSKDLALCQPPSISAATP